MNDTNTPYIEPPMAVDESFTHPVVQAQAQDPIARKRYKRSWGRHSSNPWRLPELDVSFWPVFYRNFLVWRKLALPSLVGNIAEPLIWLVAFGYGMGALIGTIDMGTQQVSYLLFLASGSICMSVMNASSFEALYSAFSRMHVQKTWDGIMNAPISLDNIVLAEMLWASFKAMFTAIAIMGVMLALNISTSPKLLVAVPVLMLTGIAFSCLALVFNALAKGYDFFTYYFTLFLTPMMFLSGVFFPLNQLPPLVADIANALPLANAIALVRPLFMDEWPTQAWLHVLVLLAYAVGGFWLALALTRKRFSV
jgi:lipooligosaccharide transport system permease protein